MGTNAMIWDADPLEGGRPLGWFAMDGHPDSLATLAGASTRKSFLLRVKALARHKDRHFFEPLPGRWMAWPASGYFVMDFGYWWDEAEGCVMFVQRQSAARRLTPEVARDHDAWPEWDEKHPRHVGAFLPELHATVDPRSDQPKHRWASFREWVGEQEAARILEGEADMEIARFGVTKGTWAPEDWGGYFTVRDSSGTLLGHNRSLNRACGMSVPLMRHPLGPENGDFDRHYRLYSVEAFLMEARDGDAHVRRSGGQYQVMIDHPAAGRVETASDLLAEALLKARRILHAHPGFVLPSPR